MRGWRFHLCVLLAVLAIPATAQVNFSNASDQLVAAVDSIKWWLVVVGAIVALGGVFMWQSVGVVGGFFTVVLGVIMPPVIRTIIGEPADVQGMWGEVLMVLLFGGLLFYIAFKRANEDGSWPSALRDEIPAIEELQARQKYSDPSDLPSQTVGPPQTGVGKDERKGHRKIVL